MKVYLVTDHTGDFSKAYLTEGEANRQKGNDGEIYPIELEGIGKLIQRYYAFRGLRWPADEFHALAFLGSEFGELADALVSSAGNWTRNHPNKERHPALEAGDVLMMLYVTLFSRGIDPLQGMIEKFRHKGFTDQTNP